MPKTNAPLGSQFQHNPSIRRVLSGTRSNNALMDAVMNMRDLQRSEYGRGYLTAASDLLEVVAEVLPAEQAIAVVARFEAVARERRWPKEEK